MENRKQMNLHSDLKSATRILENHGITLSSGTESEIKGRLDFLTGIVKPIRLGAKEKSRKIVTTYFERNKLRRSVIIFQVYGVNFPGYSPVDPGNSTVIMPNATATYDEVVCLLKAIRKIVSCDDIFIDDLYDKPIPGNDDLPF